MIRGWPSCGLGLLLCAIAAWPSQGFAGEFTDFSGATLDFFQGAVISGNRVTGLGGAYVSIAEGPDGHLLNPAAFAIRSRPAANDWFDYDLTLTTDVLLGDENDLDLSGLGHTGNQVEIVQFGFNVKLGRLGLGLHGATRNQRLSKDQALSAWYGGVGVAWAWGQGAWAVGVLLATPQATVTTAPGHAQQEAQVVTAKYSGGFKIGTIGPLVAHRRTLSLRSELSPLYPHDTQAGLGEIGLSLPSAGAQGAQLRIGASYRFGSLNPRATMGGGAPPGRRPSGASLVAAELCITGGVGGGVGPWPYLTGRRMISGAETSVGVSLGAESEVLNNLLILRMGLYFEPSRYPETNGRLHWTSGADVRVPTPTSLDLRLSMVIDVARDYGKIA